MTHVSNILEAHPASGTLDLDLDALAKCIEECFACAQTCTACADACLGEDMVADLRRCITLDLDCADICAATGAVLSRQTESDPAVVRLILEACASACRQCGDECRQHAEHHDHCRICAEACDRCAAACDAVLAKVGS